MRERGIHIRISDSVDIHALSLPPSPILSLVFTALFCVATSTVTTHRHLCYQFHCLSLAPHYACTNIYSSATSHSDFFTTCTYCFFSFSHSCPRSLYCYGEGGSTHQATQHPVMTPPLQQQEQPFKPQRELPPHLAYMPRFSKPVRAPKPPSSTAVGTSSWTADDDLNYYNVVSKSYSRHQNRLLSPYLTLTFYQTKWTRIACACEILMM